tara:strand:- start:85 stop:600 length:516 start_codon:yes stop_codon:yes gene_type:complete
MKNLITFLLIILTITSYGQTKLDKEIFNVVNEYRTSQGLNAWVWNQSLFKVAEKHNYYQTQISDICHGEPKNVKNHVEINSLGGRLSDGGLDDWVRCGENLAVVKSDNLTNLEIAKKTLRMWIASSSHKDLLLSSNTKYVYGGISSKIITEWVGSDGIHNWTYSTLNVYKK